MKTVKAFILTTLLWFGVFLAMFLCMTVITAVITGLSGIEHQTAMIVVYKGYCFIAGFIATISSILYAYEIRLVQSTSYSDEPYDPRQIKLNFDE
jgi:hypothetical protein